MQALKSIGGALLGIVIFLGLIITIILLFAFGAKVAFAIQPFVNWLAGSLFLINLIMLLVAIVPKARGVTGVIIYISSYIYGLSTWIFGLTVTLALWGWLAVVIGMMMGGIGVVPIGMLAAIFKGNWAIFWSLFFSAALTYGSRLVGTLLVSNHEVRQYNNEEYREVIDIEPANHKRTWEDIA